MFNMNNSYLYIVIFGLVAFFGVFWTFEEMKIKNLQSQLHVCEALRAKIMADKENVKSQLLMCKQEVSKVNEEIERIQSDRDSAMARYEKIKALPKEKRYEVIYKYVPMEKSNACEDLRGMLDGVRHLELERM